MFENLTLPIIFSIAGLAVVDSINPGEMLAGLLIFSIPKPLSRFWPFLIGIFLFHFAVGFILYYCLHFILDLAIFNSPVFDRSIELIGGILLIIFGLLLKKRNRARARKILDPKPLYTFLLGIGITASALPASASYFAALGIIANDRLGFSNLALLLFLYNIIFILPLLVLLGIFLIFRERAEKIFESIRNFILQRLNAVLKIVFIGIGLLLIIDVARYILIAE